MSSSLRFKLVAWLVLITSISLAVVGFTNYKLSSNKLLQKMNEQSLSSVSNSARNLYDFLSIRLAEVELISRVSIMKQGTQAERLNFLRHELQSDRNHYHAMAIVDLAGNMEFTSGTKISIADELRFQQALHGKTYISDPHLSKMKGIYVISITAPIFDDQQKVVSLIDVSLEAAPLFHEHLLAPLNNGDLLIVNREGLIIYDTDPNAILKLNILNDFPELRPAFQQAVRDRIGFVDESVITGNKIRWFYARIPHLDWFLAYSMPIKDIEAPTSALLWWTVGLIAMAAVIIYMLIYFTTNQLIIKRIKQILQVTEAVAAGNFHTRPIVFTSKDELGALALSVNGMMENIRELFEPFEAFIRHNQYAMIVLDPNFMINHLNSRATQMLGYSLEEVHKIASPLIWLDQQQLRERAIQYSAELGEMIPADCTTLVIRSLRHLKEDLEWTWYHKDGTRLYVQASVSCITHPNGELKGYVLIARDISDIKESNETKERLFTIVESARDAILTFDQDGYIFYINPAGIHSMGLEGANYTRAHFHEFVEILNDINFEEGLQTAIREGFWEFEAEVRTKKHHNIIVSLVIVPHFPLNNGELYFSAITRDITDQVNAKEALILAKQEADDANLAKGVFLARMSHEIRTPLNGIVGLSHLLEKTPMTELQTDYMRKISRSARSLSHIINDILDFSKLEVDKLVIEHHPFQLDETIDRVCETLSVLLGHKPVDFICDIPDQVPVGLIGDSLRLYQVLLNLSSNAIKFTEQGTVTLRVRIDQIVENEVTLRFAVTDTGIGMDEKQLANLFQPFIQGDEVTSRKYGGTGLGLVISKNIIENMGGSISVSSTQGVGSEFLVLLTFTLYLPTQHVYLPLPLTTLVVEDHPALNQVLVQNLQSMCMDAAGVYSWKEALQLLDHIAFDILLLDMEADDMYGEEVWLTMLSSCKRQGISTIVYTSLSGRDALEQLPIDSSPDAILVKPISRSLLYRTLAALHADRESVPTLMKEKPPQVSAPELTSKPVFTDEVPLRILIVEDNEINQTVARSLLENMMHCHIQLAGNGFEALHDLEKHTYDLILMDIHLPELDGIETTKLIRNEPKWAHIPIIAITADSTLDNRMACLEAGMSEMISKPIIPERLQAAIETTLQLHKEERTLPHLHIAEALQRIGGKTEIYREMLRKFQTQTNPIMAQLQVAIETQNLERALDLLHGIRGSSSNLSAYLVFAAASHLEDVVKAQAGLQAADRDVAGMMQLLQTLTLELQAVYQTIQKLLLD
ncbi:response regulator [Paenibacillus qinlingensis]|uniref:histidine kinase n=1 Tax=Paenibacillus qinlingensis TaxID=1837343 RepID=A0ABU1NZY3_9BACL|nr:response regulator [Paenibacillus qinlingensis]MDR6553051.1 PAS domain S-box-containing protein [Paenibacillus qinlingensis]